MYPFNLCFNCWTKGFWLVLFSGIILFATGCASTRELPPPSPRYISNPQTTPESPPTSPGSIYQDRASLFEDRRARRLNDLVTVLIVESVSGSKKAETKTGRDSSIDAGITGFLGAPLDLNLANLYGKGNTFSPSIKSEITNDYTGSGETTREGTLKGTITARVVDVLPNGNLVIESRKEITLNFEKQVLVLKGIIRPEDISADNTIQSTRIADSQIFLVGQGVIDEKQSPGWLGRVVDRIWPF
ncbi:MAG: flagellar basal body L-ring protein FlgH [Nitrospirae bacterium]|nr:MAG: flagellar basal body L-ring protein FlgH [Nitrospirota bacterium]